MRSPLLAVLTVAVCGAISPSVEGQSPTDAMVRPEPRVTFDGPTLTFDWPAVHVGVAEYDEGPTGATVIFFPGRVTAAVDVRGGAPGTIETDALRLGYDAAFVDAISFAGGSAYGLAAATGAAAELKDRRGDPTRWDSIAVVPGAIIFDLGDRRFGAVTPDEALGRAALRAARPGIFPLGGRGAGRFAMQGSYFGTRAHSGQGAAFRQTGRTKVAVFTVVNARGTVVDRDGRVVRCGNDPEVTDCGTIGERFRSVYESFDRPEGSAGSGSAGSVSAGGLTANTTITLVVTNQPLDFWALQRMATHVHSSMARAIQPFHTENDGDALFAVTTGELDDPDLTPEALYTLAADVAWDAVLASVPALPTWERRIVDVDPDRLAGLAGEYDFGTGARLSVRLEGTILVAEAIGSKRVYGFALGEPVELRPTSPVDFLATGSGTDRLQFEIDEGSATGLVLNPGPWGLPATRAR